MIGRRWTLPAAVLLLAGCAQKLTHERWEMIETGQSPEAVQATLGKPAEKLDMRWIYMDTDRGITADIYFEENRVIAKTWSDPDRGIEGSNPHVNQPGDAAKTRVKKIK